MPLLDPLSVSVEPATPLPSAPVSPARRLLQPSPDHPDDYLLELDNSSFEKFTICHKMAENYSVLSRESAKSDSAQQFGKLFHSCEELRLRSVDSWQARQLDLVQQHFLQHPTTPDDHRTADRMLTVLRAYNERYSADGWPESAYLHEGQRFVERPFKVPIATIEVNDVLPYHAEQLLTDIEGCAITAKGLRVSRLHLIWTGRIDLLLHASSGIFVVDHKTTSSGGREFEESFRLARQTLGYTFAAQMLTGQEILGCIINEVLIRAPAKTTRATLAREEFNRLTYFYSQDRIAEWLQDVTDTLSEFVGCLVRGRWPMTGPRSFRSPCVYCDYHSNCQLPRSQRAVDLSTSLYQDVTWTPIAE